VVGATINAAKLSVHPQAAYPAVKTQLGLHKQLNLLYEIAH